MSDQQQEQPKLATQSWADRADDVNPNVEPLAEIPKPEEPAVAEVTEQLQKAKIAEKLRNAFVVEVDDTKLDVILSDPKHPLYCAQTFQDLAKLPNTVPIPDTVMKGLNDRGYTRPVAIQGNALPLLLRIPAKSEKNPLGKPENMVFQSQAGTGKTAAFAIDILSRCDPSLKAPQAIVVSPTFPLAVQISEVIKELGKYTGLEVALVYGEGERKDANGNVIKDPQHDAKITAQIIVGTIGKVNGELKVRSAARKRFTADHIKVCVFDEADELFDKNFHEDTLSIIKHVPRITQIILLSATFPKAVYDFALSQIPEPVNVITLPRNEVLLDNIKQICIPCRSDEEKFQALELIYETIRVGEQTFIFMEKRDAAYALGESMRKAGHKVLVLTGGKDMTRDQQKAALERFKTGQEQVMITTNMMARGIDVVTTSLVINYDVPTRQVKANRDPSSREVREVVDPHMYAQRIGRAGRMGRRGTAITLIDGSEEEFNSMKKIEEYYGRPIETVKLDADALEKSVKN